MRFSVDNPQLVSIAVIAYNASRTIKDTLNSICGQTYSHHNIEIIISDDSSSDDTISIAKSWERENKNNFYGITVITQENNRGVAANCNQAWKSATGNWIKTIAADDILLPDCIKDNIDYVVSNPSACVVFSNMIPFYNNYYYGRVRKHNSLYFNCSQEKQLKYILMECYLLAPTGFIKNEVLSSVGYADESYPMIDDYPLWLILLKKGYKFSYFDKETVCYRIGDSLSQSKEKIANVAYLDCYFSFQKTNVWPLLSGKYFLKKWDDVVLYHQKKVWIKLFGNRVSVPYLIFRYITYIIRPYKVYHSFVGWLIRKGSL